MSFVRIFYVAVVALGAALAGSTVASATTYAAPPVVQGYPEQGYADTNLNVRQGPSTRHRSVGAVARGDVLDIKRCERGWCLISAPGIRGWSNERFIGFGTNPYLGGPQLPEPGIPPQEPGTYDRAPVGRY